MKLAFSRSQAFLCAAVIAHTAWAQTGRIPQIATKIGGRPAAVPQSYFDTVAAEAADTNNHPSLGPYTLTAVKSGNWSDPTVWSTGAVPGANASVNLGAYTITYDVASTVKIKHIHNSAGGTFKRAPGSVLWVSTQMFHGRYVEGEIGAPIPNSNRTQTIYWYSDPPGQTVKYGLVCMGPARLLGEKKAHFLNAAANLTAGATTIQLIGVSASNWKVGDEICICATEAAGTTATDPTYLGPASYTGSWNGTSGTQTQSQGFKNSQDEPRTITAISGDNITVNSALVYNHNIYSATLPRGQNVTVRPYVVNFTRSIQHRAEVASTNLQQRPHMMFMHNDAVDIRYVDILNFGRTSNDPSLYVPASQFGADVYLGTTNLANTNNVRGRYGLHIHGTGPFFGRKMVVVQGVVVRGQNGPSLSAIPVPGWGITHHNSRCAVEDCVTYNVRGAGIVSELGNEIGQWINNISIWNRGDGFRTSWSSRQETHTNHNGHIGAAFENQARGILQQKNVAISSHHGWTFHQQNKANQVARVPDKFSMRFKDPFTQGGAPGYTEFNHGNDNATYGIEQDQIHDFHDNTCINVGTGFFVAHRGSINRGDQSVMFAKRFHAINTNTPENLNNYTFYYSFYDCFWRGVGSGTAAWLGGNTFGMNWVNMRLENYSIGFYDAGLGFNYNGFWIDIAFNNVATPFSSGTYLSRSIDTASNHYFWNVMGPWTVTDPNTPNPGFTAKVRTWSSISSASLPVPYPSAPVGLGGVKPPGAATPSFTLAATSDISTTPAGYNTMSLSGTIVDYVGVRKWPEGFVTFADLQVPPALGPLKNVDATTGLEMVETNGCFNDNGTWKCRLWFNLDERRDGNYLQFPIDITLTGFDPVFLNANVVDPNATRPDLPLKPESIDLPAEVILDNTAASGVSITGTWLASSSSPGYYGSNYLHDGNTLKGSNSVRFTPTLQSAAYSVYARWTAATNRASSVPYDITHAGGTTTVTVNQQASNGIWVLLGVYNFNAGTGGNVLIRTTGTNGYVVADAVRFVPQ